MKQFFTKALPYIGTGAVVIGTLITNWGNSKTMEEQIEKKVKEALAKREEET